MLFERADNIFKGAIARVGDLDLYRLAQFVLEALRAAFLHLRFRKCFLVPNCFGIMIVKILTHRTRKTVLDTLLSKILGHLVKVALVASVRQSVLHIAVADKKMRVDVIGVGVDGKQDFVAL